MNGNDLALRPLRHFADFRGRSSRGELFYFALLCMFLGFPAYALDLMLPPRSSAWINASLTVMLACPFLAMCVRRLHDVGWSGWWIAPLLPALGIAWWNQTLRLLHPLVYPPPRLALPQIVELTLALLAFAILILLLWDDEPGANRYGPNPRYDAAEETA